MIKDSDNAIRDRVSHGMVKAAIRTVLLSENIIPIDIARLLSSIQPHTLMHYGLAYGGIGSRLVVKEEDLVKNNRQTTTAG